MADIIVVGAGVVGCAVARELSKYDARVLVLERANDVAAGGATKANSGIVHGGYDAPHGTLKAEFNVRGSALYPALCRDLDVDYRNNGALVLCLDAGREGELTALMENGERNGVKGLEILSGDAVRESEPNVSAACTAALSVPSSAIVCPYGLAIALAENAFANGVSFRFNAEVTGLTRVPGGYELTLASGEKLRADAVVNAAGAYADALNNMVSKEKIKITARRGEYVLLDKERGGMVDRTLFQLPTPLGKGVLVTPTVHGNLMVGPNAEDVFDKDETATTPEGLASVFERGRKSVPALSLRDAITQFAGLRAHADTGDFILGERKDCENFFNCAGVESPGLSAAPAIAEYIANEAAAKLRLGKKAGFIGRRRGIARFFTMSDSEKRAAIERDPKYGRVVCRCECVTEAEIVDAIRRPLGARDLDGIKRRTRAGMGRCQSGFCMPAVAEILSRETGTTLAGVTKCGGGSRMICKGEQER